MSREMHRCNVNTCFELKGLHCIDSCPPLIYVEACLVFILLAVNVVSTALVSCRHFSDSDEMTNNKINVMLIFAMNLMMFVVFFLPVSVALIVADWKHVAMPTVYLAGVNCCFDPLLYYFSLDRFWKKKDDCDCNKLASPPGSRLAPPTGQDRTEVFDEAGLLQSKE